MDDIGFGLWMTAMGMGTVFVLLLLLMFVLMGIGRLDQRGARAAASSAAAAALPDDDDDLFEPASDDDELSPDLMAAISIAVITHANVRRNQAAPAMRASQPGSQLFASRWVSVGRAAQNQPWKSR